MITLVRREFTVPVSSEKAWQHLARVEEWSSWAGHIRNVELAPKGELGPRSTGTIRLKNGIRSAFRMTEYDPFRSWKWVGKFLWLSIEYDHRFDEVEPDQTRLTWIVDAEGFGVGVLGRLFAKIYGGNLDRAIPNLIEEMGR